MERKKECKKEIVTQNTIDDLKKKRKRTEFNIYITTIRKVLLYVCDIHIYRQL